MSAQGAGQKAITEQLAELVLRTSPATASEEVLEAADCALIDLLASGIYGADLPWSRAVAQHGLRDAGGRATVPLFGRSEVLSPSAAARVNGAASHAFELDDIYEPAALHPGSTVIPAAWSVAVDRDVTGIELLAGIAVGYEAIGRIAVATRSDWGAFHDTGTSGVMGAAAAASSVAGFDVDRLANAWGLAGSFAGGLQAFQTGGGEIKRLHSGRAAEGGVLAVELTEDGLTGPHDVIENSRGFIAAFGGKAADLPYLLHEADDLVVEHAYFKPYAACGRLHSVIEAVHELQRQTDVDPDQIDSIRIGTSEAGRVSNSAVDPTDTVLVQFSLQSAAALAILGVVRDPDSFKIENYANSRAPELAHRATVYTDDAAQAAFPAAQAGRVTITMKDGRTIEAFEPGLRTPGPKDRRVIVEDKFRQLTKRFYTPEQQETILQKLDDLRRGASVREVAFSLNVAAEPA